MISFGLGGILMGRWADRFGVFKVLLIGAIGNFIGFLWASQSPNIISLAMAHGLIGLLGGAASFAPLLADTALWWKKRRGIAVAICASGNYVAGTVWPPVMQWGLEHFGWRQTYIALGCICGLLIALLALRMKPRPPLNEATPGIHGAHETRVVILFLFFMDLNCFTISIMPILSSVYSCARKIFAAFATIKYLIFSPFSSS
jgi:MFS family permease